jgi:hypothetical protein
MNLIELLRVYDVGSPKLRMGCEYDGGYVINEILLKKSTGLINIGVGGNDTFEEEWFKATNTPVEMFDESWDCPNICAKFPDDVDKKIFYTKKNVGNEESNIPLRDILRDKQDVLLKVDIEGGEYTVFDNIMLDNVSGLILEVHGLQNPTCQQKLSELVLLNFRDLVLFHIHSNVHGGTFTYQTPFIHNNQQGMLEAKEFPNVLELTFVHSKFVEEKKLETSKFPDERYDRTNNINYPDINLYWVNQL